MGDMDEIVKEFLVESYENLDQLDRDFVALETNPKAQDRIGSIFRTIHTIKGTCGCLGLNKLEAVAHVGENLLCRLRDGDLVIDTDITTGLLKLVDTVREILASIENTGTEGEKDYAQVRQMLVELNERTPSVTPAGPVDAHPAPATTQPVVLTQAPIAGAIAETAPVAAEVASIELPTATETPAAAEHPAAVEHVAEAEPAAKETKDGKDSLAGNAIRVDVNLLDKLMNLVGELVLARNQVLQHTAGQKDVALLRTAQRLNLITTELQEGVMKTRMQPIGNLWNKFPRIVRDVANACGKKVRIEMDGKETELDKTIIEAIKDPLTHVIRNSVDHGVESPEKRIALGKPAEGRLYMRAFHEGGQVNIEITDDGKGIDPEAVKRKAVERGLITVDHAARMGEREATNLIFLPGFSTAEKITNVSGRGVGMDVVKTNVERIGGTVDVQTRVGNGTTLRIKIPLTLAIIPALVVTSGGERFAIPQVSLLELVRIDDINTGIETINGTPIHRLRGNLLPLIYLNRELQLGDNGENRSANIVVLRGGDRQFGLVVDQINDTEEIVVKPLGKQLKGMTVFAGATIMGDGKVALILDVMGLAQRANVISHHTESVGNNASDAARSESTDRQTLLLCLLTGGRRVAIPLSLVARLEEFSSSQIEDAGGQKVVQYRDQIMPLIDVAQQISAVPAEATDAVQVVVYTDQTRTIGLRVDRIVDVVEERITPQAAGARPGVIGTAVIKERVTELLNVPELVQTSLGLIETSQRRAA